MNLKLYIILLFIICGINISSFSDWSQITTSGNIPQLKNHSAVYIPLENRILVFGGRTTTGLSNELWSLNLTTNVWQQVIAGNSPPAARYTQNAYFDSAYNRMIIWSGQGVELYNDVWAYNLGSNQWQQLWPDGNTTGVPLKRYGTGSIFDPVTRNIITFAGFTTSGRFEDTWQFQPDSMKWTERVISHPPKRCLHSACFAYDLRKMIIYGGQDTGPLDDIWAFDLNTVTWHDLTPAIKPPGRFFYSMIYSGNGNIIVFGGLNSSALGDMWKFSISANSWEQVNQGQTIPQARWGHSAVYIPSTDKMIIFGGDGTGSYNDTWQYSNVSVIGINHTGNNIPQTFSLEQNYPNPFNPVTKIRFSIPENINVILNIYDINGKIISVLINKELNAGTYETEWNAGEHSSGIYFYRLTAGNFTASRKLTLVK